MDQCNLTPEVCQQLIDVRIEQSAAGARIDNVERAQARIEERLDRFFWFLLGILGTSAATLLVTLLRGKL